MSERHNELFQLELLPPAALRKDGGRRRIGYAAPIASGPKGQRCGTCRHAHKVLYRGPHSHKCEHVAALWTQGEETDINLRAPACSEWVRKPWERPDLDALVA